jgi:hypothetical protein
VTRFQKLLFVLTDGGRARFVQRRSATRDFVTVDTLDHSDALREARVKQRGAEAGRSFERGSPARHKVGREDALRADKEAFMAEVAQRATHLFAGGSFAGVFLVSPRRLASPLRSQIADRAPVAGALDKDLTKVPDHQLGEWLSEPSFGLQAMD